MALHLPNKNGDLRVMRGSRNAKDGGWSPLQEIFPVHGIVKVVTCLVVVVLRQQTSCAASFTSGGSSKAGLTLRTYYLGQACSDPSYPHFDNKSSPSDYYDCDDCVKMQSSRYNRYRSNVLLWWVCFTLSMFPSSSATASCTNLMTAQGNTSMKLRRKNERMMPILLHDIRRCTTAKSTESAATRHQLTAELSTSNVCA